MAFRRTAKKNTDRGIVEGYRSGLEDHLQQALKARGVGFQYEPFRVTYTPLRQTKTYTPDFLLLRTYVLIESKGRFVTADRQKHKAIKQQYPDLDLRFVFSNSRNRIGKKSKTTYAAWCEANGFLYADKTIPADWLTEPVNEKSRAVIESIIQQQRAKK